MRLGPLKIRWSGDVVAEPSVEPAPAAAGTLIFQCNICGTEQHCRLGELRRDQASCSVCASTGRWRAVVDTLTRELFGQSINLPELPSRPDLRGLGIGDWPGYAEVLAAKTDYRNTFFERQPRLDIHQVDEKLFRHFDYLVSSDVFEHVDPPIEAAFANACRLLRPGGVFVLTVPYGLVGPTLEHFPDLHDYCLVERAGRQVLENRTRQGELQIFEELVFHGGYGNTLELRCFSLPALRQQLLEVGFSEVQVYDRPVFEHGIYWPEGMSHPLVARR